MRSRVDLVSVLVRCEGCGASEHWSPSLKLRASGGHQFGFKAGLSSRASPTGRTRTLAIPRLDVPLCERPRPSVVITDDSR